MQDYTELLARVRLRIREAQTNALGAVNREALLLNHAIGSEINRRRQAAGATHGERLGSRVVTKLAQDLAADGMKGFGATNLKMMAQFAQAYTAEEVGRSRMTNLGWTAHRLLLDRFDDRETRLWYMEQMLQHRWTIKLLKAHTLSQLHLRAGASDVQGNLSLTLPPDQAAAAARALKTTYDFSFLDLDQTASERQVEMGLVAQVALMITELGDGFAFYRQQYTFTEGDQDFRIDLLFYHVRLKCFVVVELKIDAFRLEYAGKLNFYVSSIDDIERGDCDGPTIGILLCPEHNPVIVERSVRGQDKPLHVSGYARNADEIQRLLPPQLRGGLPQSMIDQLHQSG